MRWIMIAACILSAAAAGTVAHAADKFYVGEWQGQTRYADSGKFSRCTIEGKYRSGITVDFGLTRDYEVEIWLENPGWKLRKDRSYEIEYWVDNYAHHYGKFISLGGGFGRIDASNASRTFDQLRAGVRLYVAGIGDTEIFRLDNTYVALGRLLQCVNSELAGERNGDSRSLADRGLDTRRSPAARDDDGNSRSGRLYDRDNGDRSYADRDNNGGGSRAGRVYDRDTGGASGNRKASASEFMALIFRSRNLAGFRVLGSKDIPAPLRSEEVVWSAPDALGFADRIVGKTPKQVLEERIEKDRDACKEGDFDNSGHAVTLGNGATAYRYSTVCYDQQNFFARYSIYPASDGSWHLVASLGVESPQASRDADEAIFQVVSTALRN